MHERECKRSFRRWLFAPLIDAVNCAKDEILCAIRNKQPGPDPSVAKATEDLKDNTKSMQKDNDELKAAVLKSS